MKTKPVIHRLNHATLAIFCRLVNLLPLRYIAFAGEMLGNLTYLMLRGKRRQIVYKNLKIVFGTDENQKSLNRIFRASLQNMGKMILETASWTRLYANMDHWITVEGERYLKESLEKGNGVVAISMHMGNFTLIRGKLSRMGYTLYPVIRPPENKAMAEFLDAYMQKAGVKYIPDKPRHICVKKCLRVLINNEIIFLTTDLNVLGKDATFVEFFGYKVPTFKGPAVLAARTEAAVHPMFIVREQGLRHKIIVEPALTLRKTGSLEEDAVINTAIIVKATEPYILEYPEQWFWLHDRWRRGRKL